MPQADAPDIRPLLQIQSLVLRPECKVEVDAQPPRVVVDDVRPQVEAKILASVSRISAFPVAALRFRRLRFRIFFFGTGRGRRCTM